jgi:hypothetical protein
MARSKEERQLTAISTAARLSGEDQREAAEHILMNELATAAHGSMRHALLRVLVMVSPTPARAFLWSDHLVAEFPGHADDWYTHSFRARACGHDRIADDAAENATSLRRERRRR